MKLDRYHYLFNAAAYFAAAEKFPENGIVAAIAGQGPEAFDALCWALAELAQQGELARRDMGYDSGEMLTVERVRRQLMPAQLPEAREIVLRTIAKGLKNGEGNDSDEVDEVLAELAEQKKNGRNHMTEAEYLSVALSLGMGRREALLSPVGLVMEIAKLRADANKKALEGVRTHGRAHD